MATSKPKPYQREGWQKEGEAQREMGETRGGERERATKREYVREREGGGNTEPHQTAHPISER